ncbi:MAG TPA: hypothetical protein P5349_05930 [Tenuifilaceae bacterium]|nr:hypothetical protein [Tenuifilaceae bacterium]
MSEKSYDPRMHTAEHILNQTMVRMFGCKRAFSSHIEKKKSKCDYRIPNPIDMNKLVEVERIVNEIIRLNLEVTDEFVSKEDAAKFLDLNRLPADASSTIRVVRIGDYDACACIGPHVKHTNEIGTFRIISSDYAEGILRIRFRLES